MSDSANERVPNDSSSDPDAASVVKATGTAPGSRSPVVKATVVKATDYEQQRAAQISLNREKLVSLGLHQPPVDMSTAAEDAKERRKEARRRQEAALLHDLPARKSRRLAGETALPVVPLPGHEMSVRVVETEEERAAREEKEEESLQKLLEEWNEDGERMKEREIGGRRLFLVPTGEVGLNDHTLHTKVDELDAYVWGFARSLFSRIFNKCRPGDVMLFTSAGSGMFNRIGVVTEPRVVDPKLTDKFWQRLDYNMNAVKKAGVSFPLLVIMKHKPVEISWPKREIMRLCGYSDRLMSSRMIHIDSDGTRILMNRCERQLGLST